MRLILKLEAAIAPLFWQANQPMAEILLPAVFVRVVLPIVILALVL